MKKFHVIVAAIVTAFVLIGVLQVFGFGILFGDLSSNASCDAAQSSVMLYYAPVTFKDGEGYCHNVLDHGGDDYYLLTGEYTLANGKAMAYVVKFQSNGEFADRKFFYIARDGKWIEAQAINSSAARATDCLPFTPYSKEREECDAGKP